MSSDEKEVIVKPGDWVILKGDDVIWSDKDLKKVIIRAESIEDDDITVTKEPHAGPLFY